MEINYGINGLLLLVSQRDESIALQMNMRSGHLRYCMSLNQKGEEFSSVGLYFVISFC